MLECLADDWQYEIIVKRNEISEELRDYYIEKDIYARSNELLYLLDGNQKLTNNEKTIIKEFQQTKIPLVYKVDDTDNISYVEHVDFDLCDMLLKNKKVSNEYVQNELNEFARFLAQLDVSNYYYHEKKHLNLLIEVVNIFIKKNL